MKIKQEVVTRTSYVFGMHITDKIRKNADTTKIIDHITEYDLEGRKIKWTHDFDSYKNGIESFYKYDVKGNIIETYDLSDSQNMSDRIVVNRNIYKYDPSNNQTEHLYCDTDSNVIFEQTFEYNDHGKVINEKQYGKENQLILVMNFKYNDKSFVIYQETIEDRLVTQTMNYEYSNDTVLENIIVKDIDSSLTEITTIYKYEYTKTGYPESISAYNSNGKRIYKVKPLILEEKEKVFYNSKTNLLTREKFISNKCIVNYEYKYDDKRRVISERIWYENNEDQNLFKADQTGNYYFIPVIVGGSKLDIQNYGPSTGEIRYTYGDNNLVSRVNVNYIGRGNNMGPSGFSFSSAEYIFAIDYNFY